MSEVSAHEPRAPRELFRHDLRDVVDGANDGIIPTVAGAGGGAGAQRAARPVIILGFATPRAAGFAMGASTVLAIRSSGAARAAVGCRFGDPSATRHGT